MTSLLFTTSAKYALKREQSIDANDSWLQYRQQPFWPSQKSKPKTNPNLPSSSLPSRKATQRNTRNRSVTGAEASWARKRSLVRRRNAKRSIRQSKSERASSNNLVNSAFRWRVSLVAQTLDHISLRHLADEAVHCCDDNCPITTQSHVQFPSLNESQTLKTLFHFSVMETRISANDIDEQRASRTFPLFPHTSNILPS